MTPMSTQRKAWSEAELLVAFRLYCQTPFGKLHQRNPEIIELADFIGRTPSAVAMKACNFASLDPQQKDRNIKALGNVSRADRELWEDFAIDSEAVAQKAEAAYATIIGQVPPEPPDDIIVPEGPTEVERALKTRRVQSFFRAAVLAAYENRCALTGLSISELLNASHIVPWSVNTRLRANPRNGICLNVFHDRAFDRGLITFDQSFRVVLSPRIEESDESVVHKELLLNFVGQPLRLPLRFLPEIESLEYHRQYIFKG